MEQNPKFRIRLNLFDCIVLLLAVAAGAFLLWNSRKPAASADQSAAPAPGAVTVRYVVELTDMLPQSAELVQAGDALLERTRKENMGTVESVEVTTTQTLTKDQTTGAYRMVEMPGRYTATMVVTAQATESESRIVLDGTSLEVRAGTSVRVYGPGYYGTGYIVSVERG